MYQASDLPCGKANGSCEGVGRMNLNRQGLIGEKKLQKQDGLRGARLAALEPDLADGSAGVVVLVPGPQIGAAPGFGHNPGAGPLDYDGRFPSSGRSRGYVMDSASCRDRLTRACPELPAFHEAFPTILKRVVRHCFQLLGQCRSLRPLAPPRRCAIEPMIHAGARQAWSTFQEQAVSDLRRSGLYLHASAISRSSSAMSLAAGNDRASGAPCPAQ